MSLFVANCGANAKTAAAGGGGGGTITWESSGFSANTGTTSLSVPFPTSLAAGDLIILFISMKPASSGGGSVSTPSGFSVLNTKLGSGVGAPAADNGDTNSFTFSKISDGTESGNLSITVAGQNSVVGVMHRLSKSAGTWSIASATGEQTGTGNVNVTFGSDPGVTAGDYVLCHKVGPSDAGSALYSAGAFSQSGVTFGTVTAHNNNTSAVGGTTGMNTNVGFDLCGCIHGAPVNAGPSSGNPTFTATSGTTAMGPGPCTFIRLRLT